MSFGLVKVCYNRTMKKKKFSNKDKKPRNWSVKGGRENSKKDFLTLLKRAVSTRPL